MSVSSIIHVTFSFISGVVAYWLGGYDLVLKTMLSLTILDFITGTGTAAIKKKFTARKCALGIIKKVYIYVTVALAVVVQRFIGDAIPIRETVIVFYIVSEGMSTIENIGKVIKYPQKLKEVFEQLNENE